MLNKLQVQQNLEFYNTHAHEYAEEIEWNKKIFKEVRKLNINPFCKFCQKGTSVLLIGCGTGRDHFLLKQKGYQCVGVDISEGMLSEARKRVEKGDFTKLDLCNITELKRKFDAIYCESALTHLPSNKIVQALSTFHKMLKSDGIIYTAVKIGKTGIFEKETFGAKRFFVVYSRNLFINLINKAGFKILWQKTSRHSLTGFPKWFSLIAKK